MSHIVDRHAVIDGHRISFGVHGEGEPVVLLHGTPSSSYIWRDVVPVLTEAGYRVHVFDLLGYGLSERPRNPDVDTSITGQVAVLEGLLGSGDSTRSTWWPTTSAAGSRNASACSRPGACGP
ncbi:alpha/beta fold hydrolase [Dietzia kunjamensis]|uniref:alpha/beta fold hydrolase n=1 Tax=Dietzia kunjamensis TaxID=322509 RepID=UPI0039BC7385